MNPQKWLTDIDRVRNNPAGIKRVMLNQLSQIVKGEYQITDPTNPFIFLAEASAVNTAAAMTHMEAVNRQMYPALALTESDLYLHMSDEDYYGRFATPSRANFMILLDMGEVLNRAVETPVDGIRRLTIPRHTEVVFDDITFTLQYPIDIRVMRHGGLQIVYNNEHPNPLRPLETNIVRWKQISLQGKSKLSGLDTDKDTRSRLAIAVQLDQVKIESHIVKFNAASAPIRKLQYSDQFYYARVYNSDVHGRWTEMSTTHTEQVVDPTKLTAVLQVHQGVLTVMIPEVYRNTNRLGPEIRVDIYTTHGDITVPMGGYTSDSFELSWRDLDQRPEDSKYTAPLSLFADVHVLSEDTTSGGTDGLSFEQLRERVIHNAVGPVHIPITSEQMNTTLENRGYSLVKNVDNVTNREFLATKALPKPLGHNVSAGAGCTIASLFTSMEKLTGHRTVLDNGRRITITPDSLYRLDNGILSMVSDNDVDSLLGLTPDNLVRRVHTDRYLYSPFHYVLEHSDHRFDLRAYFMDAPTRGLMEFIEENDSTGISVGTDRVEISKVSDGYEVLVRTHSTDAWKALTNEQTVCQLAFKPIGERDFAYMRGELIGLTEEDERVYRFHIQTTFDIDDQDHLYLDSFQMYHLTPRKYPTQLETEFTIFYGVTGLNIPSYVRSGIDDRIGRFMQPTSLIGVNEERVQLTFGHALNGLWSASRTISTPDDYLYHPTDVPAVYTETVFRRNPDTGLIDFQEGPDGTIIYPVLHEKGDPKLDAEGQPIYLARQGEVILNEDGTPKIKQNRYLTRQIDLLLVDGLYWFVTETSAAEYQAEIPMTIRSWLENDIVPVSKFLLEQTHLYYYPQSTLGSSEVIVREKERVDLPLEQSFKITYYMRADRYRDIALRQAISARTIDIIAQSLQSSVVTHNQLTKRLTESAGDDIVAVQLEGLGGDQQLTSITMTDDSSRLAIRKRLKVMEDGSLGVVDDVTINFIIHTD